MSVLNKCFIGFSILYISGCAAVNPPEGGPKDVTKPVLKEIYPPNGTTNFKEKQIRLAFSEDIRLKDFSNQLIVTPNTGNVISTQTNRNELLLTFDKPLEENTTYLLNFREGIEDITEGNKPENVVLAFSTGPDLDSAHVTGTVTNYLTNQPEKNVTVALYPAADTGNIRNQKPWYLTRTTDSGNYKISNLKNGSYRIYALADKNTNDIYDNDTERIGYLNSQISINGKLDSIQLKTVSIDSKKPFAISVEKNLDRNTIQYSEGIRTLTFKSLTTKPTEVKLTTLQDITGKLIYVFPENGKLPESVIALSTDSSNIAGTDTIKFELSGKAAYTGKLILLSNKDNNEISAEEKLKLIAPVPLKLLKNQPFTIIEDSIKITRLPEKQIKLNENKTEFTLDHKITAKRTLRIETDTSAVIAINGKALNKSVIPLTIVKRSELGSISGKVQTKYTNYQIEILDAQNKVIRRLNNLKKFKIDELKAGNYGIRVKIDENEDGTWSGFHTDLLTMPEKLYFYPKPITVRANWEIEDITLTF